MVVAGLLLGFGVNALSPNPLSLTYQPRVTPETWPSVTLEQMQEFVAEGSALFIDARNPEDFEKGHILNAINLPSDFFGEYFMEVGEGLPRQEIPLIVYCQGDPCDQSHIVLDHLKAVGFTNLWIYLGGWNEWSRHETN